MKPIAFASFHLAPIEASPALQSHASHGRSRATQRSGPADRRCRFMLLASAVLGSAACTVTADEFTPATFEAGADPTLTGDESASLDSGAGTNDVEGMAQPAAAPTASADGRDEAVGAGIPLASSGTDTGADDAAGGPPAALDDAEAPNGGAPDGEGLPASAVLPDLSTLIGWASVSGLGVDTTTGGSGRTPVVARTPAELVALGASPEPMTIAIEGTIEAPSVALASNKTLLGVGSGATLRGGIAIRGTPGSFVQNVIVANLTIAAETSSVEGDGIQIQYAHHVWVDHCALRDAAESLLDVIHGSDFVTVSHTRFAYTAAAPAPDHRFAALIGQDITNGAEDRGHLNVTWHHDFWGEGVSRALSARFGQIHVYNSLFRSPGGAAVLAAGLESSWLVENNQFEDVVAPHAILLGSSASLAATGNVYLQATGARDATAAGFTPAYAYPIDSPFELAASIEAAVGPR